MRKIVLSLMSVAWVVLSTQARSESLPGVEKTKVQITEPTPTREIGAQVFIQRCILCHGTDGKGQGILPLKLSNYPNTNLLVNAKSKDRQQVFYTIAYGGTLPGYSGFMPPYGAELSWTELESVTSFVEFLRDSPQQAHEMVKVALQQQLPQTQLGRQIFSTRCVLCHGKFGEGDGPMAKLITNPPPFDLTASRLSPAHLSDIIVKGGEAVGRSPQMPPWGGQLSATEVEALVIYLKTIRD